MNESIINSRFNRVRNLNKNKNEYYADPSKSLNVPIFSGVPDIEIIQYFKELSGIDKLPLHRTIPNSIDLNGNAGKLWIVKPKEGRLKGSTINLRNFSTSQEKSNAKYTIEIVQPKSRKDRISGIEKRTIEIKFTN